MQGSRICNIRKTWHQLAILFLTYCSNGLEATHNSSCALANASFRYGSSVGLARDDLRKTLADVNNLCA